MPILWLIPLTINILIDVREAHFSVELEFPKAEVSPETKMTRVWSQEGVIVIKTRDYSAQASSELHALCQSGLRFQSGDEGLGSFKDSYAHPRQAAKFFNFRQHYHIDNDYLMHLGVIDCVPWSITEDIIDPIGPGDRDYFPSTFHLPMSVATESEYGPSTMDVSSTRTGTHYQRSLTTASRNNSVVFGPTTIYEISYLNDNISEDMSVDSRTNNEWDQYSEGKDPPVTDAQVFRDMEGSSSVYESCGDSSTSCSTCSIGEHRSVFHIARRLRRDNPEAFSSDTEMRSPPTTPASSEPTTPTTRKSSFTIIGRPNYTQFQ